MHLLIIGSEYAGKTTLATEISKWMIKSMDLQIVRWHNHFVVPELDGHLIIHAKGDQSQEGKTQIDLNTKKDKDQILSPSSHPRRLPEALAMAPFTSYYVQQR